MAQCEVLPTCMFFNDLMESIPGTAELMKSNYCKKDYEACARYIVLKALGREAVPKDLFPSQRARAQALLQKQGKS